MHYNVFYRGYSGRTFIDRIIVNTDMMTHLMRCRANDNNKR